MNKSIDTSEPLNIAISYLKFGHGGSERRVLRLLKIAREFGSPLFITLKNPDWNEISQRYAFDDEIRNIPVICLEEHWPFVNILKGDALRGSIFSRFVSLVVRNDIDILINAYTPISVDIPCINFIADFAWLPSYARQELSLKKGYQRGNTIRHLAHFIYDPICNLINVPFKSPIGSTLVIANSQWSAGIYKQYFDSIVKVIYPPCPILGMDDSAKRTGVVILGRISPEKRIEDAIEIISSLRKQGIDENLHIVGPLGTDTYSDRIKRIASELPFVELHGGLFQQDKEKLLKSTRFGLCNRLKEPFGIATAEMMSAGCIPFVPNGGGSPEVVQDSRLIFDSISDAVQKISKVAMNESAEQGLRSHCRQAFLKFTSEKFETSFRNIFKRYLSQPYFQSRNL